MMRLSTLPSVVLIYLWTARLIASGLDQTKRSSANQLIDPLHDNHRGGQPTCASACPAHWIDVDDACLHVVGCRRRQARQRQPRHDQSITDEAHETEFKPRCTYRQAQKVCQRSRSTMATLTNRHLGGQKFRTRLGEIFKPDELVALWLMSRTNESDLSPASIEECGTARDNESHVKWSSCVRLTVDNGRNDDDGPLLCWEHSSCQNVAFPVCVKEKCAISNSKDLRALQFPPASKVRRRERIRPLFQRVLRRPSPWPSTTTMETSKGLNTQPEDNRVQDYVEGGHLNSGSVEGADEPRRTRDEFSKMLFTRPEVQVENSVEVEDSTFTLNAAKSTMSSPATPWHEMTSSSFSVNEDAPEMNVTPKAKIRSFRSGLRRQPTTGPHATVRPTTSQPMGGTHGGQNTFETASPTHDASSTEPGATPRPTFRIRERGEQLPGRNLPQTPDQGVTSSTAGPVPTASTSVKDLENELMSLEKSVSGLLKRNKNLNRSQMRTKANLDEIKGEVKGLKSLLRTEGFKSLPARVQNLFEIPLNKSADAKEQIEAGNDIVKEQDEISEDEYVKELEQLEQDEHEARGKEDARRKLAQPNEGHGGKHQLTSLQDSMAGASLVNNYIVVNTCCGGNSVTSQSKRIEAMGSTVADEGKVTTEAMPAIPLESSLSKTDPASIHILPKDRKSRRRAGNSRGFRPRGGSPQKKPHRNSPKF